ncbi:MAG: methionine ABC transporter ATP-binding protein, partial [Bryobacteraceae bacterium]
THDLADIEELCARLMIIDHGRLLFDGPLAELKRHLWRDNAVRVDLRDREQARNLEALELAGVRREAAGEFSCRLVFDREECTTAEIIRRIVTSVEVADIHIEEQSIEDVVKRIYAGTAFLELKR